MRGVQQDDPTWCVRQDTGKHTRNMRRTAYARGSERGAKARVTSSRTRWYETRSGRREATRRHKG
eukprot:6647774-Prymnesium_polylepis.1